MIGIYVLLLLAMLLVVKFFKGKLRILLAIFIILIALYCVIFDIDRNRVFSNRLPIFAKLSELKDYELKSTEIYNGLGYRIEVDKIEEDKISAITMHLGNKVVAGIVNDYEKDSTYIKETKNNSQNQDYELRFYPRDNSEITEILKLEDYSVKTFGGDVNIIVDGDMVYQLKDALEQNIITADQILDKAKRDADEGIIKSDMYKEGGSTEYYYDNYTILKKNSTDGDKDLIIGNKGPIITDYNRSNMKIEDESQSEFTCEVIEVEKNGIIIKPDSNCAEAENNDKIIINTSNFNSEFLVGDKLKITYDGIILTTYPAQIYAEKIEYVK